MTKSDEKKQVSDSGTEKDKVRVVRYIGGKNIREITKRGEYIEAFTHTQLCVEKILRDRIREVSKG